jgi:hypothetical protein
MFARILNRTLLCLLSASVPTTLAGSAAAQSTPAPPLAPFAEPALTLLQVGDAAYWIAQNGASIVIVPQLVQNRLELAPLLPRPDCANVERTLTRYESSLAACKANPRDFVCDVLKTRIEQVRAARGPAAAPTLRQDFNVLPIAPPDAAEVVRRARTLTGATDALLLWNPVPSGARANVTVTARADSWISKLSGFVSFEPPAVSADSATGGVVVQDNILTCELLRGRAQLRWSQGVQVDTRPLTYAELSGLWINLAVARPLAPGPVLERAAEAGARIAEGLTEIDLRPSQRGPALRFAFSQLFTNEVALRPLESIPNDAPPALEGAVPTWSAGVVEVSP